MKKSIFILFALSIFLASCREDGPYFNINYWEINNSNVGDRSYAYLDEILKIKVSASTNNLDNPSRNISQFSFGYEVDGVQGDAKGEFDQDADNVTITYVLDLQDMIKGGSLYFCEGGEEILLYLELVDYNGNTEEYTHTIIVE